MEEKAAEVTTRWQELYLGRGPTALSVADIRAVKDQLMSRDVFCKSGQSVLRPCPKCKSLNTNYNDGKVYARCRDCNAWWTEEDAKNGVYNTDVPTAKDFIDWNAWRKNMGPAGHAAFIKAGAEHGNNNPRLRNLMPPVTWFENIAVAERDDSEFPGSWSVVPPQGCEITFFGEQG